MELKPSMSALVTGGASGIDALAAAFGVHIHTYGGVDVCINCAGFVNKSLVYDDRSDGTSTWRRAVNLNLVAVIDGTRIAAQIMRSQKKPGVIINIGSVAGIYPMHHEPVYSGTKGGEMFDLFLNALAMHERLVVIGMISQYQGENGWKPQNYTGLCEKILGKSQTVAGFFLIQYAHLWQDHLDKLFDLYNSGKLKVSLDPKKFLGVASVADAVEYLHSGRNVGKVVVCIDPEYSQTTFAKL